ncbi:MAG TPA: DUF167 family protein [Lacipirellulaceae bacterium]
MIEIVQIDRGVILLVRAQAGARRNGILGVRDGMLRVAVTAAPEKGKANRAIVTVLSDALGMPKSAIQLADGETSLRKRFLILDASLEQVREALARIVKE